METQTYQKYYSSTVQTRRSISSARETHWLWSRSQKYWRRAHCHNRRTEFQPDSKAEIYCHNYSSCNFPKFVSHKSRDVPEGLAAKSRQARHFDFFPARDWGESPGKNQCPGCSSIGIAMGIWNCFRYSYKSQMHNSFDNQKNLRQI